MSIFDFLSLLSPAGSTNYITVSCLIEWSALNSMMGSTVLTPLVLSQESHHSLKLKSLPILVSYLESYASWSVPIKSENSVFCHWYF